MFASRPHDPDTGLINMRARWYSPDIGRFLSPDPAGLVDGTNLYAYASNDPVDFFDPSGLARQATEDNPGLGNPDEVLNRSPEELRELLSVEGADGQDLEDLRQAIRWLSERYPELFPKTKRTVRIGDPGEGNRGSTSPISGDITLKPGLGPSGYVGTLAHELLHSHPESWVDRVMQNVNEIVRGGEEHEVLHEMGQAVRAHFEDEQDEGKLLSREQVRTGCATCRALDTGPDGAPIIRWDPRMDLVGRPTVRELPEWSTVRRSFTVREE
jgi:RHS repeat-associated protein